MKQFEKLTKDGADAALETAYERIDRAFFIYADLLKFGTDNPNIEFFVSKDGNEIKALMMRYYSGLQVLMNDVEPGLVADVNEYINNNSDILIQVSGAEDVLKALDLSADSYGYMQTYFVERFRYEYKKIEQYKLYQAGMDDVEWIAKYTVADEFFNIRYTAEGFADEMRNRLGSNYGRCWCLKDGDAVVATIQTMAEIGNVAESGLLVVNKAYRSQGIGEYMVGYLSDIVIGEGKRLFGNFTSIKGANKYIAIGSCKLMSTLGKYYRL